MARPRRAAAARPALVVRPVASAARRLLDRRGDLGRHLARALDVDPASAARGRIASALLHAARHLGAPLRRQRGGDPHALARLRPGLRAARVLRSTRACSGGARDSRPRCSRRWTRSSRTTRRRRACTSSRRCCRSSSRGRTSRGSCARGGGGLPVFVLSTTLLAYSHNWGLFLCVGLAAATFAFARDRLRLFWIAAAGVAVLYAPWLPTLALAGAAHGRAVVDAPELPRPLPLARAPSSAAMRRTSHSCSSAARHSAGSSCTNGRRSGARSPLCSPSSP